jgi:pimeloyl-ACP methyl ester carboxylesterase
MSATTQELERPGGTLRYAIEGQGPLVVCLPGMGDTRRVYRFLVPALVEAGFRVASLDLRGHGDSDATFDSYDDVAAGTDLIALIEHLGAQPAVIVGNSMGAGAAAWAAAEAPQLVVGLALLGPFVRDVPMGAMARLAFRLAIRRPWGPAAFTSYYRRCYPSSPPADLADHVARLRRDLSRRDHWRAFVATTHTSHAPVEARLDEIVAPTLVIMGDADPDFADPIAEATLVAERLAGQLLVVPGAGHYPQAERPDVVNVAVVDFARQVTGA